MTTTISGERILGLKFDQFPRNAHDAIVAKIKGLTDRIEAKAQGSAPFRSGKLRSEIVERVFDDNPNRVAGYVSVYAPDSAKGGPGGGKNEYAKAATLEYGSNATRKIQAKVDEPGKKIAHKLSGPVSIKAFRYLRDALDEVRPDVEPELASALQETIKGGPS